MSDISSGLVCKECRALDIPSKLRLLKQQLQPLAQQRPNPGTITREMTLKITDLNSRLSSEPENHCPICLQIFRWCKPHNTAFSPRELELLALPFYALQPENFENNEKWVDTDAFMLMGVPRDTTVEGYALDYRTRGYLACYPSSLDSTPFGISERLSPHPDLEAVLSWLEQCQEEHEACITSGFESVPIRLIDCQDLVVRSLHTGSDICYTCLSYVWGEFHKPPRIEDGMKLPRSMPNVIRDAIEVTRELGYRYLWVDQYCINQDDKEQMQHAIKHMGAIYSSSEITFVAASGKDSSYGLPGSPSTPRRMTIPGEEGTGQSVWTAPIDLGDITIRYQYPELSSAIRDSVWNSRGWTFQESFLSRRLLFFHDSGLHYQCRASWFTEMSAEYTWSGDRSPDYRPCPTLYPFAYFHGSYFGPHSLTDLDIPEIVNQYTDHVTNYTSRTLRYASDGLNAFTAVIEKMRDITKELSWTNGEDDANRAKIWRLAFVQGLPLLIPPPDVTNTFDYVFAVSLCWYNISPLRRRRGFATWTWVGWEARVQSEDIGFNGRVLHRDTFYLQIKNITVSYARHGSEDGTNNTEKGLKEMTTDDEMADLLAFDAVPIPKEAVKVEFFPWRHQPTIVDRWFIYGLEATFHTPESGCYAGKPLLDDIESGDAVIIPVGGESSAPSPSCLTLFLILRPSGKYYKRIGQIQILERPLKPQEKVEAYVKSMRDLLNETRIERYRII